MFLVNFSLVFEARLKHDCGIGDMNLLSPPTGNTFPVCIHEHMVNLKPISLTFNTSTFAVKIA